MKLHEVIPWGRSFAEYRAMFSLTASDLQANLLGCGDGPASFNAESNQRGCRVTSVDPLYQFSSKQIRTRIDEVYEQVIEQVARYQDEFVWDRVGSVEALGEIRMTAMNTFLSDYADGRAEGRYVCGALPNLPFTDASFALALCSHYLFLYSDQVGLEQHVDSLKELCRVAREVRVYPLLSLDGALSPHLGPLMAALHELGIDTRLVSVDYEFQKGAGSMLVASVGRN